MIDLSNLKAPGWQRIVSELSAPAADDRTFVLRLLGALGQVAGARQGVFFSISGQREDEQTTPEPKAEAVWPYEIGSQAGAISASEIGPVREGQIEQSQAAKGAAQAAGASRQTRVYALDGDTKGRGMAEEGFYEGSPASSPGSPGYIVAVPIAGGLAHESGAAPLRGVATLLLDSRSKQALQTTLALIEVLAGYVYTHSAQSALRRTRQAGASLDLATRLIASINTSTGFKACAFQLVNDLCRQLALDRVALGMVRGAHVKTRPSAVRRGVFTCAISDTENIDRRMAMVQRLEAAMEECLDQAQPVVFPVPPDATGDAVLSRAITHAHRELASGDARLRVGSLPLRVSDKDGERIVGVVTIESMGEDRGPDGQVTRPGIEPATIELLQAALDLVAPVLLVRQSDDRSLALRTVDSCRKTGAWLVGPTHTGWKLAGMAVVAASLVVTLVRVPYRVGAPMEIRAREMRTISAPYDGTLWSIAPGVEANARVQAGQVLAELDTTSLRLGLVEARNEVLRFEKEADEYMKKGEVGEAQQATARADQARAKADRYENEISRARLVSPISGVITSPDVKDKIRSAVKLGDPLFQVADTSDLVAVVWVEDRDIAMIKEGQAGEVSPKSDPARNIPVVVERIVPLSVPKNNVNSFEIRAAIRPGPGDSLVGFIPGVEGQARLESQRMSLLQIGTRRIVDQLRMWLWW